MSELSGVVYEDVTNAILDPEDHSAKLLRALWCCGRRIAEIYRWSRELWLWIPAQPGWHAGERYWTRATASPMGEQRSLSICPDCGRGMILGRLPLPDVGDIVERAGLIHSAANGDRWQVAGQPELIMAYLYIVRVSPLNS